MRITTNMIYNRNLSSLSTSNQRIAAAYEQLDSGKKFKTAGEDPAGMSQKMALTHEIEQFQQYAINGNLLENRLGHQETVLDGINNAMLSAQTLIQKANNSALNTDDRKAIASELESLQQQMFDLMNNKNSQGEFIFGGHQSKNQPFVRDDEGNYTFQGDSGQQFVQVSSTVSIPANESGQGLFEMVATRNNASVTAGGLAIGMADQGAFDNFHRSNYDAGGTNEFSITTQAGDPASYQILDANGDELQSGSFSADGKINFNGLELEITAGETASFALNRPKNDNILNTMSDFITTLRDPDIPLDQFQDKAADISVHLNNARNNIDQGLGEMGGRLNMLDQVMSSNDSLKTLNINARAEVSEVDLYEVIANLAMEEAALSATQLSFSKISKMTLFDYMR
ncbi:MAG: flagellar hook-associated protein FlgL [Aeromonas sp.]